jgi:hypothetical protein
MIFTNCNVCGVTLRTDSEDRMGMCERCAGNGPLEKPVEAWSNPSADAAQSGDRHHATAAVEWEGPKTHEEARCFHQGFLSGLTVYARESGASTLKRDNPLLKRLMDEQGWKTIEEFERISGSQP